MDILECIHRSATGETHETDPVDPNLSILWDESKTRVLGFRLNGLGEWFQNMDPSLLSDIRARNLDDIVELVRGQMAAEHAVDRWYRFFKGWVPGVSVPDTIWDNMLGH